MKKRLLQKQLNDLRRDLNAVGPRHDRLRDGLKLRDTQVDRLNTHVDRLLTRVNGLNDRVDVVEAGRAIDIRAKAKLLDEVIERLGSSNADEVLKKLNWLHDRVDLLANKQDALTQRHDRVTYSVGQFDARLTRLEQPKPPAMPRKRAGKPATAENGVATPDEATPPTKSL